MPSQVAQAGGGPQYRSCHDVFINHCPDPSLTLSFQLKAPEEWTAAKVQDCLDRNVRKMKINVSSQNAMCLSAPGQCSVDVTCQTAVPLPVPVTL